MRQEENHEKAHAGRRHETIWEVSTEAVNIRDMNNKSNGQFVEKSNKRLKASFLNRILPALLLALFYKTASAQIILKPFNFPGAPPADTRYIYINTEAEPEGFQAYSNSAVYGQSFLASQYEQPPSSFLCPLTGYAFQYSQVNPDVGLSGAGAAQVYGDGQCGIEANSSLTWYFTVTTEVEYEIQVGSTGEGWINTVVGNNIYDSGMANLNPSYPPYPSGGSGVLIPGGIYVIQAAIAQPEEGYTLDGSWDLNLTISPTLIPRFSQQTKNRLMFDASNWSTTANIASFVAKSLVGYGYLLAEDAQLAAALSVDLVASGIDAGANIDELMSYIYEGLALDPADSNFTVIAQPIVPMVTNLVAGTYLTQAAADAGNAWLTNKAESLAFAQALYTSINRAQGATLATNTYWETAQMNAAVEYEAQLATYLDQEPVLRSNFEAQLVTSGFPSVTVTPGDVFTNEIEMVNNGFDTNFAASLAQLGADGTTITNIEYGFMAFNLTNCVTFPQSLLNPSFDAAVYDVAAAFRDSSMTMINLAELPNGEIRFDLPTEAGITYSIQFSTNLANSAGWSNVLVTNATATLLSFTNMVGDAQSGFYRASHN